MTMASALDLARLDAEVLQSALLVLEVGRDVADVVGGGKMSGVPGQAR